MSDNQQQEQKQPDQDPKLMDHNYDGIQELDNPLPKWWIQLFYGTVIFAIIYFIYYSFGYGDSLETAHAKRVAELQNKSEQSQDIGLAFVMDDATIQEGKKHYDAKCAACHKPDGGGLIGPNLTDSYWIHGTGSNDDIFEVIKEGVPEKGMLAWKTMLSPSEMAATVVYIQSLKGSNPANAKPPQGEKY